MRAPSTWVVGAGGLLGSQVRRVLGDAAWTAPSIGWRDPDAAAQLSAAAKAFRAQAGPQWRVAWCAGAGVTSTGPEDLAREVLALRAVLDGLGDPEGGRLFLSSSAGGVYAGATPAPFDEHSPTRPLAPYGHTKLEMEALAARWGGEGVVLGRIANLYGPGQDIRKPQGLISQLCRAHVLRQPQPVYVSLDTIRDYLYVDDAARLVVGCLARASGVTVKVIASQQGLTVGAVLAEIRRVSRRTPRLVLSASNLALVQAPDLRLRSVVWTELDDVPLVPFPVGVRRTLEDLSERMRSGELTR